MVAGTEPCKQLMRKPSVPDFFCHVTFKETNAFVSQGDFQWALQLKHWVTSSAAVSNDGKTVYFGSADKSLFVVFGVMLFFSRDANCLFIYLFSWHSYAVEAETGKVLRFYPFLFCFTSSHFLC